MQYSSTIACPIFCSELFQAWNYRTSACTVVRASSEITLVLATAVPPSVLCVGDKEKQRVRETKSACLAKREQGTGFTAIEQSNKIHLDLGCVPTTHLLRMSSSSSCVFFSNSRGSIFATPWFECSSFVRSLLQRYSCSSGLLGGCLRGVCVRFGQAGRASLIRSAKKKNQVHRLCLRRRYRPFPRTGWSRCPQQP